MKKNFAILATAIMFAVSCTKEKPTDEPSESTKEPTGDYMAEGYTAEIRYLGQTYCLADAFSIGTMQKAYICVYDADGNQITASDYAVKFSQKLSMFTTSAEIDGDYIYPCIAETTDRLYEQAVTIEIRKKTSSFTSVLVFRRTIKCTSYIEDLIVPSYEVNSKDHRFIFTRSISSSGAVDVLKDVWVMKDQVLNLSLYLLKDGNLYRCMDYGEYDIVLSSDDPSVATVSEIRVGTRLHFGIKGLALGRTTVHITAFKKAELGVAPEALFNRTLNVYVGAEIAKNGYVTSTVISTGEETVNTRMFTATRALNSGTTKREYTLWDQEGKFNCLWIIFDESKLGKAIDLSTLDPYAEVSSRYSYEVNSFYMNVNFDGSKSNYLADPGSVLLVTEQEPGVISIFFEATKKGVKYTSYYIGSYTNTI